MLLTSRRCVFCGAADHSEAHLRACAKKISRTAEESGDPFEYWKGALVLDRIKNLTDSEKEFKLAAQAFYEAASKESEVSRAMFEYSTLLDAFANIQQGRLHLFSSRFSKSIEFFEKASEILRSTIHFAFLAPYDSACATLETAKGFPKKSEDIFQAYKNAIALLEQSKLVLNFRDESHPLMKRIQALLLSTMSEGIKFEAGKTSNAAAAKEKFERSKRLDEESKSLLQGEKPCSEELEYFPLNDWSRVKRGAFVIAYPVAENVWLLNLGVQAAEIEKFGTLSPKVTIESKKSTFIPLKSIAKGKLRVVYTDLKTGIRYDEGCMSLV